MSELPVLDDWDGYEFPEEDLPVGRQRMAVRDPIKPMTGGDFAPVRLDVRKGDDPCLLDNTLLAVSERMTHGNQIIHLALNGTRGKQVLWLLFSPYEVFLEKVLAERMKTLELGEVR